VRVCNEDYLFCRRLRDSGWSVVLHAGVRCGHYDRGRDRTAPAHWETDDATAVPRVLVQNGDRFAMVPLAGAPPPAAREERLAADVVYVVAEGQR
jgi:hypothetical protein